MLRCLDCLVPQQLPINGRRSRSRYHSMSGNASGTSVRCRLVHIGHPRFCAWQTDGRHEAGPLTARMGLESARRFATDTAWRSQARRSRAKRPPTGMEALMTTATSANPATPTPRDGSSRGRRLRRTLYRGDPGMWSWVLHRITGATIFFFLFVHVLDTALVRVSPQAYNEVIDTYKTPIVGLMELGLVAAVLFHALNGIRVILIDFWAQGTELSAADAVGGRRRLATGDGAGDGRRGHPHGGAFLMSSPDLHTWARPGRAGPAAQPRPAGQSGQSAGAATARRDAQLREVRMAVHAVFRASCWCSWRSGTCS